MKRAQNKVRRILTVIETLAPLRMPFTIQDAIQLLEMKTGHKFDYCERTIMRDLELLISMNMASLYKRGSCKQEALYKMNLREETLAYFAAAKAKSDPIK